MDEKKEYIDREAVLTVLKAVFDETSPVGEEQFGILKAHRIVREAPAADVAPVVHGEWIKNLNKRSCSECGYFYYSNNDNFNHCPDCGAKMDGERKEE